MQTFAYLLSLLPLAARAVTIAEINGDAFISPYKSQSVTDVTGLVLAKGPYGIWIRSTDPDDSHLTSEAIYVYSSSVGSSLSVGDIISLDGYVSEYRSSDAYLYLTEIGSPSNVQVVSSDNAVEALVIGEDTASPPNVEYSYLDGGDVFAVPNNESLISVANPTLDPSTYGLDFWESLCGELVTIKDARAISRPNSYGDTWVFGGGWKTTSGNDHGGLTMSGSDGNPEGILIGSPLDDSNNPDDTKMGDLLEDITGVITYAYGFYRILPLTGLSISSAKTADYGATSLTSSRSCSGITVADYNVENLMPDSDHLPLVADHIVNYMLTPDLVNVQEIQDNSGSTDDGAVSANETLGALVDAIASISDVTYEFASVDTENDTDGGQPGGNIRVAFLYNPDVLQLAGGLRQGGATDANEVLAGPTLKYNPGRIDPQNAAWDDSRKPIVAEWEPVGDSASKFFTVNVHWASKGGSSSLHGDARPPVNGGVEQRIEMANVTGTFVSEILAVDPNAAIIASGDFNEFAFVEPMTMLEEMTGMRDVDAVLRTPVTERYTYLYDMNTQALDHMLVSPSLQKRRKVRGYEHLHLNSWASDADVVSDHDPSIAVVNVCASFTLHCRRGAVKTEDGMTLARFALLSGNIVWITVLRVAGGAKEWEDEKGVLKKKTRKE
ncbi:endonuclease/Exonuclease/phosphatase [Zalerion maritima]|uniref:Endonuclease/Exonuclease/phosphatase n=1 Tax=Zalerion maritima TaxID=339359 RepID=A0AAD5RGM6_9PEZI|nr:endonuclease/Exonuclease/phosphatase [Zalerion maritima]